jgi:hypothetical protein
MLTAAKAADALRLKSSTIYQSKKGIFYERGILSKSDGTYCACARSIGGSAGLDHWNEDIYTITTFFPQRRPVQSNTAPQVLPSSTSRLLVS